MNNKELPLFIIKRGSMSRRDIARIEKHAGLLVVESDDPASAVSVSKPCPSAVPMHAQVALELFRRITKALKTHYTKEQFLQEFCTILITEHDLVKPVTEAQKVTAIP